MYPGIELRMLRYVVAVAEELHFSRAAEKLHVAQPSLSKQIREVEQALGLQLFDRSTRKVRLTQAGAIFVQEAREALLHSQRAIHLAKSTGNPVSLSLGYSPNINVGLLTEVRTLSTKQFPQFSLNFVSAFSFEQMQMIGSGALDAGLVVLPVQGSNIKVKTILIEPLLVALSHTHRLSQAKMVQLSSLSGMPLITVAQRLCPLLHEQLRRTAQLEGLDPRIVQEVTHLSEAIGLVGEGLGYAFVRECDQRFKVRGVVYKKITDQPLVIHSGIAYRPDAASPVIAALVASLGAMRTKPPRPVQKAIGMTA